MAALNGEGGLNPSLHSPSTRSSKPQCNSLSGNIKVRAIFMASPSENSLDRNSGVVSAQTGYGAEHSLQSQQEAEYSFQMHQGPQFSLQMQHGAETEQQRSKRTIKSSKSSKKVKLATITLEEYMNVFKHLTDGKGNVVQPNRGIRFFTLAELISVSRLHALPTSKTKENLLQSLVGVELWNPYMLTLGPLEAANITDGEMQEALRVLQW